MVMLSVEPVLELDGLKEPEVLDGRPETEKTTVPEKLFNGFTVTE